MTSAAENRRRITLIQAGPSGATADAIQAVAGRQSGVTTAAEVHYLNAIRGKTTHNRGNPDTTFREPFKGKGRKRD